jgi:hypothetical protein
MPKPIPDITTTEQWIIHTTLQERYGHPVTTALADAEVRLHPADRSLTVCPVIAWQAEDGCQFLIFKTGEQRYRCLFYYQPYKQMGTGRPDYDELAECVVAILQAQADFYAEQHGDLQAKSNR